MVEKNGREWAVRILLTITALAVGFGVSYAALAGQVRENTTKIQNVEKTLERIEGKLDDALRLNR